MAIKVKRKTSRRDEAAEPDQIYTFNEKVFNYIETNKLHFGIGLAGILIAVIVVSTWRSSSHEGAMESGGELLALTEVGNYPIGVSPYGEDDTRQSFETAKERAEAVRAAVAPALAGDDVPAAAALSEAGAAALLGEVGAAQVAFDQAASADDDRLAGALALQGVAAIQASTGNLDTARASLATLGQEIPALEPYSRFELARLTEAAGEWATAERLYREFANSASIDLTVTGLVDQAEHRADVLAVVLGLQAEATDETADDDAGDE